MARALFECFMCERCHHRWVPRHNVRKEPKNYPKRYFPYWNKPRKINLPPARRATPRPAEIGKAA